MKITGRIFVVPIVLLAASSMSLWAGDNIQISVSDIQPNASVQINGNNVIQGPIQLYYTVKAYSFTPGSFGSFKVHMTDLHLNGALNAVYPAPLTLKQNGVQSLILEAQPSNYSVSGLGWSEDSEVTITIPAGVPNADGTMLVGNLNFTIPGSYRVGTPTMVQVQILLEWPTYCLKVYNFIGDAGAERIHEDTFSLDVKVKDGVVKSASPGTISYNTLVSNFCDQNMTLDIGAVLDRNWRVSGAQGAKLYSATGLYSAIGDMDLENFDVNNFNSNTNNGKDVCFRNETLHVNQTVLMNIKIHMQDDVLQANLGSSPFVFSTALRLPESNCAGPIEPMASPNPVSAELRFNVTVLGPAGAAGSKPTK